MRSNDIRARTGDLLSQFSHNLTPFQVVQRIRNRMLDSAMTLQEFLAATNGVPEVVLRAAMTTALAVEPARTPGACRRFYVRVIEELHADNEPAVGSDLLRHDVSDPCDVLLERIGGDHNMP